MRSVKSKEKNKRNMLGSVRGMKIKRKVKTGSNSLNKIRNMLGSLARSIDECISYGFDPCDIEMWGVDIAFVIDVRNKKYMILIGDVYNAIDLNVIKDIILASVYLEMKGYKYEYGNGKGIIDIIKEISNIL